MKNIRVISNCATAISDELREAVRAAREAGYEVEVRVAWEQEDGALFAREAADAGCERIIVCGGDGTWSAAARGVFGSSRRLEVRLGLVPCGTGNDFARMFKLDTWGLPRLLPSLLASEQVTPLDMIQVRRGAPGEEEAVGVFVNVATGGFVAEVTPETPALLKHSLGGAAYVVTGLLKMSQAQGHPMRVEGSGLEPTEGRLLGLCVGNGRYAGGGFDVCPEARPDNGLMEVTMAAAGPEGARVTRPLWEWLAGDSNDGEHVRQARTSRLVVSSEMSVQFNLDGEPVRGQRFIFEVIPDALAFVLPAAGTRPA